MSPPISGGDMEIGRSALAKTTTRTKGNISRANVCSASDRMLTRFQDLSRMAVRRLLASRIQDRVQSKAHGGGFLAPGGRSPHELTVAHCVDLLRPASWPALAPNPEPSLAGLLLESCIS